MSRLARTLIVILGAQLLFAPAAEAAWPKKKAASTAQPGMTPLTDARLAEIQSALDEQRLTDAGRMIDQAIFAGSVDSRLMVLNGELNLSRARYNEALTAFKQAETSPATKARALQGKGVALALLQRSDEAFGVLQLAVTEDPMAWRAWNALGGEYDRRRDWQNAEKAYARGLDASNRAAIVLNNRGFSRILQGRLDDAIADLVGALEKKPDLAAARTNLRLAMGLKGDYDRALAGAGQDDKAALLNNVGYAALLRGDHAQAEDLFNRAISAKGEFYGRASSNLEIANGMKAHAAAAPKLDEKR